jgi:hypothetical protein
MASCRFTLAASVLGAREIGYWATSDLIFDQALSPERICALFRSSFSKTTRRNVAFMILCGSIRDTAQPQRDGAASPRPP